LTAGELGVAEAEAPRDSGEAHARGGREEERAHSLPAVAASASTARPAMRATDSPAQGLAARHSVNPGVGDGAPGESVGAWAIQVGAFADEGAALRLAESLRAKGYPTELLSVQGNAGRWRVRVQPMSGETIARETAATLKRVERLPTWVLLMETS
jgi:cell division septation protein DedD